MESSKSIAVGDLAVSAPSVLSSKLKSDDCSVVPRPIGKNKSWKLTVETEVSNWSHSIRSGILLPLGISSNELSSPSSRVWLMTGSIATLVRGYRHDEKLTI